MVYFLQGMSKGLPQDARSRLTKAAVGAGVAIAAASAMNATRKASRGGTRNQEQARSKFLMPQPVVDAICGAVGEVSQIVILYPLETIKVRCQADCLSARAVIADMTRNGWGPHVIRQLYAGIGSAAAFSVVVGAIHWLTFCTAKRAALDYMVANEGKQQQQGMAAAGDSAAAAAAAAVVAAEEKRAKKGKGSHQGPLHVSASGTARVHVSSGHHLHDEEVVLAEVHHKTHPGAGGSAATGSGAAGEGAAAEAGITSEQAEHDLRLVASANMVGATVGAVMTALVEGPLELFRHQAQAGLISGNLFKEMGNVVRTQGPMGLYWGFLPYCMESFPYDISELATYSQLRDVYNQAVGKAAAATSDSGLGRQLFGPESKVPQQVWDICMGAAAGSAATLISMPFDVVKTYMQTHATDAIGLSAGGQVVEFFRTGSRMVAQHGPGALWVGVVPRLAQQVPSCTICWWAVEACQQALKPWTAPA